MMPFITFHFSTPLEMVNRPFDSVQSRAESRGSGQDRAESRSCPPPCWMIIITRQAKDFTLLPHYRIQHRIRMTEVAIHFCEINCLWEGHRDTLPTEEK